MWKKPGLIEEISPPKATLTFSAIKTMAIWMFLIASVHSHATPKKCFELGLIKMILARKKNYADTAAAAAPRVDIT